MNEQLLKIVYQTALPFESSRVHAAAISCSDGRFGEHVDDFLHNGLKLPRYDRLTLPGGAACLAGHFLSFREEEALLAELRFLIQVHRLRRVALVAHRECAFYTEALHLRPDRVLAEQIHDLAQAAHRVRSMSKEVEVEAYFLDREAQGIRFWAVSTGSPVDLLSRGV
jgi:hypothetical protein